MLGRVLRPATGKTDAIVLDHAGAIYEHGFIEEPVTWTLLLITEQKIRCR